MTITEFLLGRIAEDEAAALAADPVTVWRDEATRAVTIRSGRDVLASFTDADLTAMGRGALASVELWGQYHAGRVLAECKAKRAIVENFGRHDPGARGFGAAGYAVQCLAAVYSDHPDYNPEWRP